MKTGIEIAFGEFGFLGTTSKEAVGAFKDVRAALVKENEIRHVKKDFPPANDYNEQRQGLALLSL